MISKLKWLLWDQCCATFCPVAPDHTHAWKEIEYSDIQPTGETISDSFVECSFCRERHE